MAGRDDSEDYSDATRTGGGGLFTQTHWSWIDDLRAGGVVGERALEKLCGAYRKPLLCFARAKGLSLPDAEDLVQGFFEQLLKRDGFAAADAAKGKLRNFLLAGLIHHGHAVWAKVQTRKRGGGRTRVPLEGNEPVDKETPERIYERAWARDLLNKALEKVREGSVGEPGGERVWAVLGPLVTVIPAPKGECAAAARALGRADSTVRSDLRKLRKCFHDALYTEVAMTLEHPSHEEVLAELRAVLAAAG